MASVAPLRFRKPALLIEAAGKRRKITVSRLPFTISRAAHCDASIPDFRVSRLQAQLVNENGEYLIVDAASRHGTFVYGQRRDRSPLENNDQITFWITEAEDAEDGEFGLDRVESCLRGRSDDALGDIKDAVGAFRAQPEIQDDCTLVIRERTK